MFLKVDRLIGIEKMMETLVWDLKDVVYHFLSSCHESKQIKAAAAEE